WNPGPHDSFFRMSSLHFSVPDDFKNVFDQKTKDLPRKPKLVVGGKIFTKISQGHPQDFKDRGTCHRDTNLPV
uniref:Uncharacterized protein n=1 Tax=Spermophilus dauricus TaxID=99837 RepID=A0A8C9PYB3_SPEDA